MKEFFGRFNRGDRIVMARHTQEDRCPVVGTTGTVVDICGEGIIVYWDNITRNDMDAPDIPDWMHELCHDDDCCWCWPNYQCYGVNPDTLEFIESSTQNRFEVLG